jgi:hypothetical protein
LAKFVLLKRYTAGLGGFSVAWDCLPNASTFSILTVGNDYYQVCQWISLPVGTLSKIYIEKTDVNDEYVYIYITAMKWTGVPDQFDKIYNTAHLLVQGENEIDIDIEIDTADCYCIGVLHTYANDPAIQTVTQSGYGDFECAEENVLPSQTNTTAAEMTWNTPSTLESLRHKTEYVATLKDVKTIMITSNSFGFAYSLNNYVKIMTQQIEFKADAILNNVEHYVFEAGVPTAALKCSVFEYDASKDGKMGELKGVSEGGTPIADHSVFLEFDRPLNLPAGIYVFTMQAVYSETSVLDVANDYIPVYSLHEDAYFPGLNMEWYDGVWTELTTYKLRMKIRYELS